MEEWNQNNTSCLNFTGMFLVSSATTFLEGSACVLLRVVTNGFFSGKEI